MVATGKRIKLKIIDVLSKNFLEVCSRNDINDIKTMVSNPDLAKDIIGFVAYNSDYKPIGIDKNDIDHSLSHEWITVMTRHAPVYNMETRDVCVIYIYDNSSVYIKPFFGISKGLVFGRLLALMDKNKIKYTILDYDISSVIPYVEKSSMTIKNILASYMSVVYSPITSVIGEPYFMEKYSSIERFSSIMAFWLEKPIIERIKKSQEMEYMLHCVPIEHLPRA